MIARRGWISHATLNGVTDILQMNTKHISVFMLNGVLMIDNDDLQKYLTQKLPRSTERIVFVANVGRTKSYQVYISPLNHPGCHWTLLYVDLKSNMWNYCDTSCWGLPSNLKGAVLFIVTAIYRVLRVSPKSFARIVEGHWRKWFCLFHSPHVLTNVHEKHPLANMCDRLWGSSCNTVSYCCKRT